MTRIRTRLTLWIAGVADDALRLELDDTCRALRAVEKARGEWMRRALNAEARCVDMLDELRQRDDAYGEVLSGQFAVELDEFMRGES